MALTRAALREMGVTEKEIIDAIMTAHGETVEAAKEKVEETTKKAMQKTIDALQDKVDNTPEPPVLDVIDWKQKYEDEIKAHGDTKTTMQKTYDNFKSGIETEKAMEAKKNALYSHLEADGANKTLIPLLEKEFDIAVLKLDGDKIIDWETHSKPVKEKYAGVYGDTIIKGADVATPHVSGGGGKNYVAQLEAARKSGNTQDAVRIKTEAAKDGVFLI